MRLHAPAVVEMLKELSQTPAEYNLFWQQFGSAIKRAVLACTVHRLELVELLRFESSLGGLSSLRDYADRTPDEQKHILFDTAGVPQTAPNPGYERLCMDRGDRELLQCVGSTRERSAPSACPAKWYM